ncbi:hypothetical protein [Grimontia hollisae]|uniref:hypothetical protein n=1 Tax=Grimontia hollisae TaxID=673 RepID=UPI00189CEDE9|nr:hypothetical protein [Grimontia hollisae]
MKSGRKIAKVEFLYRWRKPVNKEEQAERAKLAQEKAPIEHAEMVYDLVMDFVPGQSGNPTVEELNGMMMHSAKLIERKRVINPAF